MGSIGAGIGHALGGVANGVSGLFGDSSQDRANTRDQNKASQAYDSAGNYLGQQAGTIGQEAPYLSQEAGAVGGVGQQAGSLAGQAGMEGGQYAQYEPGALNSFMTMNGLNADGSINNSFDPLGNGVGSQLVGQYGDAATQQGDQAVSAANKDMLGRGLGQSTLNGSEIGNIRQGQTQDVQNFTRNLGVQDAQMKQSDIGNAVNTIMGVGQSAKNGWQGAGGLYGSQAGGYGNVAAGTGNMASGYGNVAGGFQNIGGGWLGLGNNQMNQKQQQQNQMIQMAGMFA